MFKKLITNLPFSPGLVSQMGFYLKRLRQEEFIRRMGIIFTALSIAVQMISIAVPPTHAQASNENNMVHGGLTSKAHLLQVYDNGDTAGHKDIDDIFTHFGVTRSDLEKTELKTISSASLFDGYKIWTMGRQSYFDNEKVVKIDGTNTTMYLRPWAEAWGTHDRQVLIGQKADGSTFAVIMNCGNLAISFPPEEPKPVFGDFQATCKNVSGWAIDPRLLTTPVTVRIDIDGKKVKTMKADNPNEFIAEKDGDHGFRWQIPDSIIDGKNHTVVVTAIEDVGARGVSEGNKILVSSSGKNIIKSSCYEEPPEETMEVCRKGSGVITIKISKFDPTTDFADKTMCDQIEICVDDILVPIERWEHEGEPLTCPRVQVCILETGLIRWRTTDIVKKNPDRFSNDLTQCSDVEVCDPVDGLIIVKVKDRRPEHKDPYFVNGESTCQEPIAQFTRSKLARNITEDGIDTVSTTAKPGDHIVYVLTTVNTGWADGKTPVVEQLGDILEYANLIDFGGGDFNADTNELSWGEVEIKAQQNVTHTFEVMVKDILPTTATNLGNPQSHDFKMVNKYGNRVVVKLPEPVSKKVEQFAGSLPNTGPAENSLFIGLFVLLVFFFYFRNRLVTKELNMLRKDFRGGI